MTPPGTLPLSRRASYDVRPFSSLSRAPRDTQHGNQGRGMSLRTQLIHDQGKEPMKMALYHVTGCDQSQPVPCAVFVHAVRAHPQGRTAWRSGMRRVTLCMGCVNQGK